MVHKTKRVATIDLLPVPKIVRAGTVNINVPFPNAAGVIPVTLSPALTGNITDYLVFATGGASTIGSGINSFASANLIDLATLNVLAYRDYQDIGAAGTSPATHIHTAHTPVTHSSIDVNVTNPHTHDSHTVTHNPAGGHNHTTIIGSPISGADDNFPVAWMIVRI